MAGRILVGVTDLLSNVVDSETQADVWRDLRIVADEINCSLPD